MVSTKPVLVNWTDGFHSYLVCFPFLFHSYCATVLQYHSSALTSYHFPFLISHWTASLLSHYLSIR